LQVNDVVVNDWVSVESCSSDDHEGDYSLRVVIARWSVGWRRLLLCRRGGRSNDLNSSNG